LAPEILLQSIGPGDQEALAIVAIRYFSELDPSFAPEPQWKEHLFGSIMDSDQLAAKWILKDAHRIGFALFGIEKHRFLPRRIGIVYDYYLDPAYRRLGIGKIAARQIIEQLRDSGASTIQLEVMTNNEHAMGFWKDLGFRPASIRFTLR
jgi:ribosomal protein S18 acetylase RimI-like enzyme